jgi:hypothetical protein
LGYLALEQNSGNQNTAIGAWSLFQNTSGGGNTALGVGSLSWNETGNHNVAIGFNASNVNGDGYSNTAVGYEALFNNTASENTAIGNECMHDNMTGTGNVAMGQTALRNNIDGNFNTAIGWDAMKEASGSSNTAMGASALKFNQYGSGNVAIGLGTLEACLSGSNNTALGTFANFNPTGTGDYQNSTAIGFEATINASNQMILGNAAVQELYCMGAYNSTISGVAPNLYVDGSGKIMRIENPGDAVQNPNKRMHTIDFITIDASSSQKTSIQFPGANTDFSVSISPKSELPDGLILAYARVTQTGMIEIKFTNVTSSTIQCTNLDLLISLY